MPKQPAKDPRPRAFTVAAIAATLAISLLATLRLALEQRESSNPTLIGGSFALNDASGKTITDQMLRGKPFLVYFGYTHCPDICPTELARISEVLSKMGSEAPPAVFITVDPERDTPKVMQDYVSSFDPHIIGLSGSPQAIGAVEKAYHVFARRGDVRSDGSYSMDHSSIVYLINKDGRYVEALNLERAPEETVKELKRYL